MHGSAEIMYFRATHGSAEMHQFPRNLGFRGNASISAQPMHFRGTLCISAEPPLPEGSFTASMHFRGTSLTVRSDTVLFSRNPLYFRRTPVRSL